MKNAYNNDTNFHKNMDRMVFMIAMVVFVFFFIPLIQESIQDHIDEHFDVENITDTVLTENKK